MDTQTYLFDKIEIETLLISTAFIYFIKKLSKVAMHCFVSLILTSALKGNLIDCSVFSPVHVLLACSVINHLKMIYTHNLITKSIVYYLITNAPEKSPYCHAMQM